MGRLSRAQLQERNRAKVLAAARDEFTERGFRGAKIDGIAERAGFTRGAVYSNFPGKRALYFSVLADLAEQTAPEPPPAGLSGPADALGGLARAWLGRLPLSEGAARLGQDLLPEILAEEPTRRAYAQLMKLNALLLGLTLENLSPAPGRRVRLAESTLTILYGAAQLAATAPGFVEPFNVVAACRHLAGLELDDWWPVLPWIPRITPLDQAWSLPYGRDVVTGGAARPVRDGVVAVLGVNRLEALEEAVRGEGVREVTAVLVTGDPDELAPLARLTIADLCACLRQAVPHTCLPRLQVILDPSFAAATGLPDAGDDTEVALRVESGRLVLLAEGRGACHAAAGGAAPAEPAAPHLR
ncbi:TetR/AcrR family transcriptional regulator [Acrocarpospora catenulata]|uniref:TetR/AcrR family transcriptional regulator n=1 Tax=Acrocarpospora catenulata TaxID=2836182 RepID=UPI001BDAF432|nr:TetR/AcrR family transcriptional regulator [Acrocarpospora catenulata]